MSKWPSALTSMYVLPPANQEIILYQGDASIRNQQFSAEGSGKIYLQWNPRKQIVFEVTAPFTHSEMYGEGVELTTEELSLGVPGRLLHLEHSYKEGSMATKFLGLLGSLGISYGTGPLKAEGVMFHLTNFGDVDGADFISKAGGGFLAGRHILQTDEWLITLDSLNAGVPKELEQQGGYCITQVCKLERLNGMTFDMESAQNILEALSYFLSFTRGLWIPSILPVGVNGISDVAWRLMATPAKASSWQNVNSSFQTSPFWPERSFANFLELWDDKLWSETIKRCVHWYVEGSLKAGGVEGSIILLAAAFELLAWTILFDNPATKKFDDERLFDRKVSTKGKLELLLGWAGASKELPLRYKALGQITGQENWQNNGAEIFITVRNSLTHSSPKNQHVRSSIPTEALHETYLLGMDYLKGFIQKLLNYPNPFISAILIPKE